MPCRPSKVDVNNDNLMRKSDGDAKRASTEIVAVVTAELIVILNTGPASPEADSKLSFLVLTVGPTSPTA
jgi:hypothetical protein